MKFQIPILVVLVCTTVSCSHNSVEPTVFLPDLTFSSVSYSIPPGPLAGVLEDTLYVQNIGQGEFYGLLYIAQTSERYYQRTGLYGEFGLLYSEWDSNSVKPARIAAGQTVRLKWFSVVPNDTNVIRFHISTDTIGRPPGIVPLPTYPESNFGNNDYLLTITN
ncbi:MAG: hypothetical protein WBD36_11375 [Bacteroidota bacterium]